MKSVKPYIVVPTYNERLNIKLLIEQLFQLNIPNLSVLIVDDNSPDGTAAIVRSLQPRFPSLQLLVRQEKHGLGPAYLHGFHQALEQGADSIVQMDADFSHDPADVPRLLKKLGEFDLVLGSRYSQGISVINWPLRRLLISIAGNIYTAIITGMPFKDATGGFKAWRATTLTALDLPTIKADGYGFQIVMTYRAWKRGLRITEVPIIFTERRDGQSKMNKAIIREALLLVWKLRFFG